MEQAVDILHYEPGLRIAVRAGYKNRYGQIVRTTEHEVIVQVDGEVMRFRRDTRFLVGGSYTRYNRPYLVSIAKARAQDEEYAKATARAAANLKHTGN